MCGGKAERMEDQKYDHDSESIVNRRRIKGGKLKRSVCVILIAIILFFIAIDTAFSVPVRSLAREMVSQRGTELINLAVFNGLAEADHNGITELQTDETGNSFLYVDAARLNHEASSIALEAQKLIRECGALGVELPIGSIAGLSMFTGSGAKLRVSFTPIGSVHPSLEAEFNSAGVNQTEYCVYLTLKTSARVVVAGKVSEVELSQTTLLFETLIVGNVPQAYTNIDSVDDALNLLPDAELEMP